MNSIHDLKQEIFQSHGAGSIHLSSIPVRQILHDSSTWEGMVEVFMLSRHPQAQTAYGWTEPSREAGRPPRHIIVLHLPPVDSPQTAVREALTRGISH